MMHNMDKITQRFTEDFFHKDGILYKTSGEPAGHFDKKIGYYRVKAYGKAWLTHRVIFALEHGWWPKMVDHIDRDKTNNKVSNLRAAYRNQNTVNSQTRSDNTSGWRGVIWHKAANGYVAQSSDGSGKRVHLGVFTCPKEAALAYNHHAEKTWGQFASFNQVF